jgi:crossover junction endodeoxyribonuclease RuvC
MDDGSATYIMGIDPGQTGGIAVLAREDRVIHNLIPMCITKDFASLLTSYRHYLHHIYLEKAQAMPKQGVSSMFVYGQGFGELIGAITACKIPFTLVNPRVWQKEIHAGTDAHLSAKDRTLQAAKRLFPAHNFTASARSRKDHMGMVDALMICEYGIRKGA